ncbi:hypothetical protein WA538_001315, partial [Blastocystis sp. DL]
MIGELQDNLGHASSNLATAYKKMAQNMESSLRLMANMSTMMESFLLLHLEVIPSVWRLHDSIFGFKFTVRNNSNIPLKSVTLQAESRTQPIDSLIPIVFFTAKDESDVMKGLVGLENRQFVTTLEELGPQSEMTVESQARVYTTCNMDITLSLPSPGGDKTLTKTIHHSIIVI